MTEYIVINNIATPAPMRKAPKNDRQVYLVNLVCIERVSEIKWSSCSAHTRWLNQGFIHATYAAADAHANALLSFTAK